MFLYELNDCGFESSYYHWKNSRYWQWQTETTECCCCKKYIELWDTGCDNENDTDSSYVLSDFGSENNNSDPDVY